MRVFVSWPAFLAVALWLGGGSPVRAQAPGSFIAGAGTSGEWAVDGSREDLLLVQLLPAGRAWVAWLDHEEDGRARRKEGTGAVLGNRIVIDQLMVPSGIPQDVDEQADSAGQAWGSLVLTFDSCEAGMMAWDRAGAGGRGSLRLLRVSGIAGMPCGEQNPRRGPAARGAAVSGLWGDAESGLRLAVHQVPVDDDLRPRLFLLIRDAEGRPTWLARWAKRTRSGWLSLSGPVVGRDDPEDPEGIPMLLLYRACDEMWASWVDPATQELRSAVLRQHGALAGTSCAGWVP